LRVKQVLSDYREASAVFRIAVVVSALAVMIAPQAMAGPSKGGAKYLPPRGILVPNTSLAGIKLGDTMERVKQLWGTDYKVCVGRQCPYPTWYYIYPKGEPLGASVRFKKGKVVTIFTLGSPTGWRTKEGLIIGEQIERITQLYGKLTWNVCIGYGAMTMRTKQAVTSIYTTGESVYGFALSHPKEPVCN
jgi:hypothetical protein